MCTSHTTPQKIYGMFRGSPIILMMVLFALLQFQLVVIMINNINACDATRLTLSLNHIRSSPYSIVKRQECGDKSWNEHGEYGILRNQNTSNLIYIYNPKTGSDTVRFAMRGQVERSNKLSKGKVFNKTELQNLHNRDFVFTTIRSPEERITSAYSTMMNRLSTRGWAHRGNLQYNITRWPNSSTDIPAWEEHFRQMVHVWMTVIAEFGWENNNFWWDQHLIPQYEYLKGYNISYICCTNALDRCFSKVRLDPPTIVRNSYEKAAFMPNEKFQSFHLLKKETKALVRKL